MRGAARRHPKTKSKQMVLFRGKGRLGRRRGRRGAARPNERGGIGRGRVRTRLFAKQKSKTARRFTARRRWLPRKTPAQCCVLLLRQPCAKAPRGSRGNGKTAGRLKSDKSARRRRPLNARAATPTTTQSKATPAPQPWSAPLGENAERRDDTTDARKEARRGPITPLAAGPPRRRARR